MSQSQGRPLRLSHADIVRWRAQLLVTGTCHVWMGAVGSDGYGRIAVRNPEDGARTLAPHKVGPGSGTGRSRLGRRVHDCEVRLCCRAEPGASAGRHPEREHAASGGPGAGRSVPARVGSTSAARPRYVAAGALTSGGLGRLGRGETPHVAQHQQHPLPRRRQLDRLGPGDRHERGRVPTVRARRADCRRVTMSGSRVSYGKTAARHQRRPASASRARCAMARTTTDDRVPGLAHGRQIA